MVLNKCLFWQPQSMHDLQVVDKPWSIISIAFGAPDVCDKETAEMVTTNPKLNGCFMNFLFHSILWSILIGFSLWILVCFTALKEILCRFAVLHATVIASVALRVIDIRTLKDYDMVNDFLVNASSAKSHLYRGAGFSAPRSSTSTRLTSSCLR
jgi:hypothetical protein